MKCLLYTTLLSFFTSISWGQNHVPNASFEQYTTCPSNLLQLSYCNGWYQYTTTGSADYYNACATSVVGVPTNMLGMQAAAHGNAYSGIITYWSTSSFYKEYIARAITPLQIGLTYEVSLSVSLADTMTWGVNDMGVYFFDNGAATLPGSQLIPYTPQVSYSGYGPITDKNNWVRLTGSFFADSAYDNIIIGGFSPASTITAVPVSGGNEPMAYYFIDSVVVRAVSAIAITSPAGQFCAGGSITVPFILQNATFAPGNVLTLQLSDATGSFTSPINIGTLISTASGSIQGVIPPGTPGGAGYKVRVVSSNPSVVSNTSNAVVIIAAPAGVLAGSNSPVCAGGTINLTSGSTTPGVSYGWTGPLSYAATTQNASRTNASVPMSGWYVLTVNNSGCTAKDSVLVSVNPSININATNNGPVCPGGTLILNSTSGGPGTTYNWYGPNSFTAGTQNTTIPGVIAAAAGVYMVVANNGPCTDTAYTTVNLGTPPATPTAGSNSPVCSGNNINLTALSPTPGVTYSWTGPLGYSSTQQNPTRTNASVPMSGTYTVTAAVGACPAPPVSIQVVVNQTPAAPVATNNGPLCAGAPLDLFATAQAGATYQWNGPMSFTSSTQNPTLLGTNSNNAGIYTVTRAVNGCTSAPGSTTVVINNAVNPSIAVFPSPNDTICPGQAVVFVASPNNGGTAPQYQWKRNGNNIPGAVAATYNTSTINTGDFFSCELTSNAVCAVPATAISNNILMTVEPPQPCAVTITANPGLVLSPWELVTFTATPVRGGFLPTYQWLRNGQLVIGAVSAIWGANNLNSNDTISVVLFSNDPCAIPNTDTSNYLVVNIKTGINGVNGDNALTLYPNPNNGDFIIKGSMNSKEVAIEIMNAIGQLVYSEKTGMNNTELNHKINLNVANGVYLLKLRTESATETIRFRIHK